MRKIFFFLIIASKLNIILNMNFTASNEFCLAHETDCKGQRDSNNNYKIICQDLCHGNYSTNCQPKMCSTSKEACEYLKNEQEKLDPFFNTIYDEIKKLRYNYFQKMIRPCSKRNNWQSNEICLNKKTCLRRQPTRMRAGSIYHIIVEEECPCPSNHTYYCEENICATNRNACNGFRLKFVNNKDSKKIGLKKCNLI